MAHSDGATPPVDIDRFRAVMREAGVEEVVETTVAIYLAEAPAMFDKIEAAVRSGDAEATRRAAHALKSPSGNIRAGRLSAHLQLMETRGMDGDVEGARAALAELRAEHEAVLSYLRGPR